MWSTWRNFRLAPKYMRAFGFASSREIFRSPSSSLPGAKKSERRSNQNLFDMSGGKHLRDLDASGEASEKSFSEDSGFINDRDLSFNCDDLSFGNKNKFTVSVEGNIGSGKTTLLEYFKGSSTVEAMREPVDQWTNIRGCHNALQLLYEDPKRWSFSFNMYAQLTRVQMHMKEHSKPIKLLERSLYSTRLCFVENDFRNGVLNGMEYKILTSWYDWLVKSQKAELDLIVYVRADPEVCFERIKRRSRKEEVLVPFKLIQDLHVLHEEWLIEQSRITPLAPVIVLDANREYSEMTQLYETHRQEILCGYV